MGMPPLEKVPETRAGEGDLIIDPELTAEIVDLLLDKLDLPKHLKSFSIDFFDRKTMEVKATFYPTRKR